MMFPFAHHKDAWDFHHRRRDRISLGQWCSQSHTTNVERNFTTNGATQFGLGIWYTQTHTTYTRHGFTKNGATQFGLAIWYTEPHTTNIQRDFTKAGSDLVLTPLAKPYTVVFPVRAPLLSWG